MSVNRAWPLFCLYRTEAYAILARDGGWRVRCGARVAGSPFQRRNTDGNGAAILSHQAVWQGCCEF